MVFIRLSKLSLMLFILMSFFILFFATGCDSQKYNKAISHIKEKDWDLALENLKEIPDYKNTKALIAFAKANKYLAENGESAETYKKAIEIVYDFPGSYEAGELDEDMKNFRIELTRMIDLEEVKNLILNGEYKEASVRTVLKNNEGDLTYMALYNYASALEHEAKGDLDMMKYYLALISDDYDGPLSKEIKSKIVLRYDEISEKKKFINMKDPAIGMTAKEVENSTWGSPQDINKTTTASGVSEQWVYSGYRYIYLENGIVTAIQE